MNYQLIQKLNDRLYFTGKDVAEMADIQLPSAQVLCARYIKQGIFIRLKNNFYILSQKWDTLAKKDFLRMANFLQAPSYISFMTALSCYEITTQVQRNFWESACLKRSIRFEQNGSVFNFHKLKKELYFDFVKIENFFIATPEKALLDTIYLYSYGKYTLDVPSLDLRKLNKARIKKLIVKFPSKTQRVTQKLCRI